MRDIPSELLAISRTCCWSRVSGRSGRSGFAEHICGLSLLISFLRGHGEVVRYEIKSISPTSHDQKSQRLYHTGQVMNYFILIRSSNANPVPQRCHIPPTGHIKTAFNTLVPITSITLEPSSHSAFSIPQIQLLGSLRFKDKVWMTSHFDMWLFLGLSHVTSLA